ncbi:heme exporter protein CcmD [Salana multivorans]|uniref:heme exporter protein CcmD n=1 Tax=Salana multivorans TaxID=120377 RepID=UPI0011CD82E4|nr:heme exporter protein CcmD [Salana multivorans]
MTDDVEPAAEPGPGPEAQPVIPEATTADEVDTETAAPEPIEVGEDVRIAAEANPAYVRRAPRFGAFVFAALFLAALIAGVASFVRDVFLPPEELVGRALDAGGMFLLLFLVLSAFFVLAAYGIAVALDRRSVRRMLAAREAAGLPATDWPAVPDVSARRRRRRREGTEASDAAEAGTAEQPAGTAAGESAGTDSEKADSAR